MFGEVVVFVVLPAAAAFLRSVAVSAVPFDAASVAPAVTAAVRVHFPKDLSVVNVIESVSAADVNMFSDPFELGTEEFATAMLHQAHDWHSAVVAI